jgi:hypothetical protein
MDSQERTLLDLNGCRLTDRRLVTPGGATYVLQQITSTRLEESTRGGELVAGLLLGAVVAFVTGVVALGVVLTVGAVLAALFVRHTGYTLYLTTAGGEKQAITSRDGSFMVHLRDTLNDALASSPA